MSHERTFLYKAVHYQLTLNLTQHTHTLLDTNTYCLTYYYLKDSNTLPNPKRDLYRPELTFSLHVSTETLISTC